MTDPDSFEFVFGNPYRKSGRFYEMFTRFAHRWIRFTVDCRDAKAPNQKIIEQTIEDWGLNSDFVRVNVLGEFPEVDADTLIPLHLIESARLREAVGYDRYRPVWGLDVARFGDDRTVLVERQGKLVLRKHVWRGIDLMQIAGRVKALWDDLLPDDRPSAIVVDSIGIGAGVVDRLREFTDLKSVVRGLNVSESPAVKSKFVKLRDEMFWKGREFFEGLNVRCEDVEIGAELADILYGFTSAGQIKIEAKHDIKERLGRSPDVGEAFLLSLMAQDELIEVPIDRYERARRRSMSVGGSAWAS